jgi:hypothetical protein
MGLAKRFNIGERFRVRFEATFTNCLNHTNFAPTSTNIASPAFGACRRRRLVLRVDFSPAAPGSKAMG